MELDDIVTDERDWPIVVHATVGIPSEAAVDAFIDRANAILDRGARHVVIFDSSRAGRTTGYMRRRNQDWLRANEERLARHCVGLGLVFPSAALRFVMSTAMLFWNEPVPYEIFGSLDDAKAWARNQL